MTLARRAILVVSGAFLLGALCGASVMHIVDVSWIRRHLGLGSAADQEQLLLDNLTRELDLDAQQRARLVQLFDEHRGELQSIRRKTLADEEAFQQRVADEVRAFLRPAQRKRFDVLVEHQQHLLRQRSGLEPASSK